MEQKQVDNVMLGMQVKLDEIFIRNIFFAVRFIQHKKLGKEFMTYLEKNIKDTK